MNDELFYQPLPKYDSSQEVQKILESGSKKDLMLLSLGVGENHPDWKFAQDTCLKLAESDDEGIRANACLGLAYIARTKGNLEKHLVKPILLRELREQTDLQWRILDAINDINNYLGWKLAFKHS